MPTTLHLQHASLQFSDPDHQVRADLAVILDRGAHATAVTEATRRGIRPVVREVAERHAHKLVGFGKLGDVGVILPRAARVIDQGHVPVIPGKPGPAAQGGHAQRGIGWVTFEHEGDVVSFHVAHWLTGQSRSDTRKRDHTALTHAMIEQVRKRAPGRRLSFFAGDVNVDEARDRGADRALPDYLFEQGELRTVWDELGQYPDTHGRSTLDVIGSCDLDGRVRAERARVWHRLNSDHRQVSAWYKIGGPS